MRAKYQISSGEYRKMPEFYTPREVQENSAVASASRLGSYRAAPR